MTRLVKKKVESKFQNDKDSRRNRSKDDRRIDRQCFDHKDENGRQTARNQEGHNTYMMNGRHAVRNQEGHNTYEKKIKENLKTVDVLLYKY